MRFLDISSPILKVQYPFNRIGCILICAFLSALSGKDLSVIGVNASVLMLGWLFFAGFINLFFRDVGRRRRAGQSTRSAFWASFGFYGLLLIIGLFGVSLITQPLDQSLPSVGIEIIGAILTFFYFAYAELSSGLNVDVEESIVSIQADITVLRELLESMSEIDGGNGIDG